MRLVDRRVGPFCFTRRSVPSCCRHCAAASASSDAAARHPSTLQSQPKRPGRAVADHSGQSATQQAAQDRNDGQHINGPVLTQLEQSIPALPDGEASFSHGGSGTDSQGGTYGQRYLAWWDGLTRRCVLASTVLLALSFTPQAASSAAGTAVHTLPAWTVRAEVFSRNVASVTYI